MAGFWYRAGTVSVTNGSKKIVGSGTLFKTTTFKPDKGHTFYGPDGKPYEIDYVESDTVLYLVKAYTGPTASGQSYEIDITRTSTIPALSREISSQLAYAQGQYDSWQQILTGAGDVTLTAPDGQSVTVPALSNMLSKSGNLAGLADKPTARNNLGLGDAATKNVGFGEGTVAAGDHFHNHDILVGGDVNTFYPVLIEGRGLSLGVAIDRNVHNDMQFGGSLSLHLNGIGYGWGSNSPYVMYQFSQLWGGGNTSGCLADVATGGALEGVYVWLRGGRTYRISSAGQIKITILMSGMTDDLGASFMPKATGPLYQVASATSIGSAPLFNGPLNNNKPYWNGENFPVQHGTWGPYFDDQALITAYSSGVVPTWTRVGNTYNFIAHLNISGAGSLAGNRVALRGLPFHFGNQFRPVSMYESRLFSGTPSKSAPGVAMVTGSEIQFFYKDINGSAAALTQEQLRPDANGSIELILNITIVV